MARLLGLVLQFLSGGGAAAFTGPLLEAYRAKLNAANDAERLRAEHDIAAIAAARDIAVLEAGRAFSATALGRWLIVVPFGCWWAAIYLVQILNPLFGWSLVVIDVPARIHDLALVLIPAIVLADAGALVARQRR
jgi:hypothetical protein